MTTSTPLPAPAAPQHPHTARTPVAPRRLAMYSWWALLAWPAAFAVGLTPILVLYPEGEPTGRGVIDLAVQAFAFLMLCAPPLTSFVLASVAFRRGHRPSALAAPVVLIALVAAWGVQFYLDTDSWWAFAVAGVLTLALACVALVPRRVGSGAVEVGSPDVGSDL